MHPLHLSSDTEKCQSCVPAIGFRFIGIIVVGILIGFAGLQFIETPPSAILLSDSKKQNKNIDHILDKLTNIEIDITAIKESLARIDKNI